MAQYIEARAVAADRMPRLTDAEKVGLAMLTPYAVLFAMFVIYPIAYGLWLARDPATYVELSRDPIFFRAVLNTVIFLVVAINLKMALALALSSFFIQPRWWIRIIALVFILPWALPSIPTILSIRFMLNPEWGIVNTTYFRLTLSDGPNWLNDPMLALGAAMLTHIWKSLPFWTLTLIAGRLAISHELYEAAAIDGATPLQQFRHITWPSMAMLYITCTLLSTIWTLGDFNSVYLLTAGGPADLTHVLATLGIRYLRLDQVDLYMAAVVCALPVVAPLIYFMMRRLSQ